MEVERENHVGTSNRLRSIYIDRPILTEDNLKENNGLQIPEATPLKTKIKEKLVNKFSPSRKCCKNWLLGLFPFIKVIRKYKPREYFLGDLISGLTNGVMHIVQGMGFALLTNVPPIYGIYASFFPVVIYFFFGTSYHASHGTMPITSIMLGAVVFRESGPIIAAERDRLANLSALTNSSLVDEDRIKVGIAMSASLICGIFQLIMSFLHLDFISIYMSQPFVGGFTACCSVHIITSQFPAMTGIKGKLYTGPLKLVYTWIHLISNITTTNLATLTISILSLSTLILTRECINDRFKSKMLVPIPIELIVITIGTVTTYLAKLNERYGVAVVGHIPLGMPAPMVPPMTNAPNYIIDGFLVAIVSYTISMSMSKLFTKKYRYEINANQELFATGLCNTVTPFFQGFAGCDAPPRTMLHDSVGGKTQVASVYSAVLLLLVLLVIGSWFEPLPIATLGSVITFAVLPMLLAFRDLKRLWPISKVDFAVWVVTFTATLLLDIDWGLAIGLGFNMVSVVARAQMGTSFIMGRVGDSDVFRPMKAYQNLRQYKGLLIYKYQAPIFFGNAELMKRELYHNVLDPNKLQKKRLKAQKEAAGSTSIESVEIQLRNLYLTPDEDDSVQETPNGPSLSSGIASTAWLTGLAKKKRNDDDDTPMDVHAIIIDCASVPYIDSVGASVLLQIYEDYEVADVSFALASCNQSVLYVLDKSGYLAKAGKSSVYVSLNDALEDLVEFHGDKKNGDISHHLMNGSAKIDQTNFTLL